MFTTLNPHHVEIYLCYMSNRILFKWMFTTLNQNNCLLMFGNYIQRTKVKSIVFFFIKIT